jgi:alpha/beta superfamily hydrolase
MPAEPLREFAGPAGPLEALLEEPAGPPRAACVFSHPHPLYGGTMHTKAVY